MKAWLVVELPETRNIPWLLEMLSAYGIKVVKITPMLQRLQEPATPGEDVDPETILPKEY